MCNQDIRRALELWSVRHWQLAEKMNISSSWLSVKLRHELSSQEKMVMLDYIQEIIDERSKEGHE